MEMIVIVLCACGIGWLVCDVGARVCECFIELHKRIDALEDNLSKNESEVVP